MNYILTLQAATMTKKRVVFLFFFSLIYLLSILSFLNYNFIIHREFGNHPLVDKINVFPSLIESVTNSLLAKNVVGAVNICVRYSSEVLHNITKTDSILLILTSILIGINILLLYSALKTLSTSKPKFFVGGSGLMGVVSAGCTSCGISIFSILGLGLSLSFLPYGSRTLYLLSFGSLIFSILYITKKLSDSNYCKVVKKR